MNKISPSAKIDSSTKIGINNVIEDNVIIRENCIIGNNNYFQAGAVIGPNVIIGNGNFFGHFCYIGGDPQDVAYQGLISYVKIGDNNKIREFVTIHRGTKENSETIVGNNNFMMAYSHMGHNAKIGNNCVIVNNAQMAGYSELGNFVVMSAFCAIHQFCKVGDYVMIGGDSKINKDVPPFTMVFGVPAKVIGLNIVGLRRNNFSQERRNLIKEIYKIFYHSNYIFSEAIKVIETKYGNEPEAQNLINFYKNSKRGIVSFIRGKASKGEESFEG
ncbi:MAG: acyl-ACP--UDP-N-acetylglucosamine O-acyltransferase [Spirochaetes bacterium]|nr:acyl-ACP--UDP-N-acetylglucosamine O-acyltransferase [Spirochaetota bacterium]